MVSDTLIISYIPYLVKISMEVGEEINKTQLTMII